MAATRKSPGGQAGAFSSIALAYQSAETINHYAAGRPVVILYVGDHEPAGVLIDVARSEAAS